MPFETKLCPEIHIQKAEELREAENQPQTVDIEIDEEID